MCNPSHNRNVLSFSSSTFFFFVVVFVDVAYLQSCSFLSLFNV